MIHCCLSNMMYDVTSVPCSEWYNYTLQGVYMYITEMHVCANQLYHYTSTALNGNYAHNNCCSAVCPKALSQKQHKKLNTIA